MLELKKGGSPSHYVHKRLQPPSQFDPRSFRTIPIGRRGRKAILACRKGSYSPREERCKRGMEKQAELVPITKQRRPLLGDSKPRLPMVAGTWQHPLGRLYWIRPTRLSKGTPMYELLTQKNKEDKNVQNLMTSRNIQALYDKLESLGVDLVRDRDRIYSLVGAEDVLKKNKEEGTLGHSSGLGNSKGYPPTEFFHILIYSFKEKGWKHQVWRGLDSKYRLFLVAKDGSYHFRNKFNSIDEVESWIGEVYPGRVDTVHGVRFEKTGVTRKPLGGSIGQVGTTQGIFSRANAVRVEERTGSYERGDKPLFLVFIPIEKGATRPWHPKEDVLRVSVYDGIVLYEASGGGKLLRDLNSVLDYYEPYVSSQTLNQLERILVDVGNKLQLKASSIDLVRRKRRLGAIVYDQEFYEATQIEAYYYPLNGNAYGLYTNPTETHWWVLSQWFGDGPRETSHRTVILYTDKDIDKAKKYIKNFAISPEMLKLTETDLRKYSWEELREMQKKGSLR